MNREPLMYEPCRCPKCSVRVLACPGRCPCPECQPGPGVDFEGRQSLKARKRSARLRALLEKPDPTAAEDAELEELLHWTIHRS